MGNEWRHTLCTDCYGQVKPGRVPHLVRGATPETCCNCGGDANPPIYYRASPNEFSCCGSHATEEHDDASGE
jgi:hypothetical protein